MFQHILKHHEEELAHCNPDRQKGWKRRLRPQNRLQARTKEGPLLPSKGIVECDEGGAERNFSAAAVPVLLQEAGEVLGCKGRCLLSPVPIKNACTAMPFSHPSLY